jgi:hypothetical protein
MNISIVDSSLKESLQSHLQFVSDRHFSRFKTPIEYRHFTESLLDDSLYQEDFSMSSWYSISHDTIDLVAHVGSFETAALLLRFVGKNISVFYYRAPHSQQKYFRLNKTDTFSSQVEVPAKKYLLKLAEIPSIIKKQPVFGYIDMESSDYYDNRDSLEKSNSVKMKFYFRSQYRQFNY